MQTVPLLTVFAAASVNVSAMLAGRPLPGIWAYVVAALLALGIFFQMRAFDEAKDLEDDRRYRPERPIPRGLVSLRVILGLAALVGAGMLALAWAWNPATRGLLLLDDIKAGFVPGIENRTESDSVFLSDSVKPPKGYILSLAAGMGNIYSAAIFEGL